MSKIELPWGKDQIAFDLPQSWSLPVRMEPAALAGVSDARQEVERSLQAPYETSRLVDLARGGKKIVIVMDDGSRPTPVSLILPAVLAELQHGSISMEQITVIPALGVHRAMTEEEIGRRIGGEWIKQARWENPDCDDLQKLSNLGITSRGTPVFICKTVAEADLVISIGCIEPHIIASFGGGFKNLFPGVAGRITIAHNHALNCRPDTFNMVGQPIERNPMRLDLEEAGRMLKPPVFIVNAVLNSSLQVVRVVCGDAVKAHRAGVQISAQIYGVEVPSLADVVITDSHPMDSDLRQGVKALANTVRAVRQGGVLITLVKAEEGVGVFGLANLKMPLGRGALKLLAPVLLPLVPKLKLKGMGEEDRLFLYFALQAMRHCKLLIYGPTIPLEIHERLPFVTFVGSPQEAVEYARQRFPGKADVIVFPDGGSTYPILPGEKVG